MTAREFIALKDLKDECWSQDTEQLALAMEEYAKQKSLDAFRAALELTWGPFTDHGERVALEKFNEWLEENE